MPYSKNTQLPEQVTGVLPKHAQDIYRKAYNNAVDPYQEPTKRRGSASREETAHKVAWNAVKKNYKKGNDGKWHTK